MTPQGHANLPSRLTNLGGMLCTRFQRSGELSDLTDAITLHQKGVKLTPRGHADLPAMLNNLGVSFTCRFERTGELSDIADAIAAHQKAVELTPQGHADLPGQLNNLGNSFSCRFERTGELSDVADAIEVQQKSVELTPLDHADLPGRLNNLGNSFTRRFERTGELSDIADAITVQQKGVELTPQGHADLPGRLNNLGVSFTRRFERTDELSDIANAISVHQKAVELSPQGDANFPGRLNNLGWSFACRFGRTGGLSDIAEAISVQRKAMELTPQGHPNVPGYLNNLGNSFTRRFERTGELSDIADAITVQQKGVELTPQGHADLPRRLSNLGLSFTRRFERTGGLSDIAEAISVQRKAVDLTPQGHADLPGRFSKLGLSFTCRFERTGGLSDIAEAISVQRKAMELTPQGHPNVPGYLNNLGGSLTCRFARTGELSDIAEAIAVRQEAVELTPQGHANLPVQLNNLGGSFTCRFERTGELSDIANAIGVRQKAVELTPQGHAHLPAYLTNLGSSCYRRYSSSGKLEHLEEAISFFKTASISSVGSLRVRLEAAQHWAGKSIQYDPSSPGIIAAFDKVLSLVAVIAGLEKTVQGRYTQLEETSGLALEAAAVACALERPDKALEWLEQGRCLVWNPLNNLRTPLDDLRMKDEILAQEIANVSQKLESAGSSRVQSHVDMSLSEKMSLEVEARAHSDLAKEWDDLLRRARAIRGFECFLMPSPSSAIMLHLPESGPIIVINVNKSRCDALALLAGLDEPLHIPLPNFSIDKATKYRKIFDDQLRARKLRAREDLSVYRALRGLWEEVVKPVLDALGFSVPPRVWWCPTGPLSFLPLHSAGIYRGSIRENVSDYVVSSYTPTVTALTNRVKNPHTIHSHASGLFLTSQPNTPSAPPIPGTTKEVQCIFKRAEESRVRASKLEGDEMSVAACLERMQEYSSIHLACHGSQNAAEPLKSRFLFHRGALELGTILKSSLKNADLAFLSACQTSTGEEKLSDEAVHLAAGMLAAGYRRVIGTMWSIGDTAAQKVATTFYDYLFSHRDETSGSSFDGSLSAVALHDATRQLRLSLKDSEDALLTWIPFVHFGL
ncbi:CHAT domain-containing protein [Ephemerocybe angulata]|uniref:CHAT domain-containing protein n=1 Tax=Ephemerocybe angulata TaxID=980116 RepID=A0A8H6IJ99_9AGAR|nr:CHAT domain-containing protein [Tulosesus angulatus]